MNKIPFGHTPDTELFCQTKTHREALNTLLFSINSGESFCKIIGEVGSGKTMLCRVLIRKLEKSRKLAYIPNPNLTSKSLKYTLAKELGLKIKTNSRDDQISHSIQSRLIKLNKLHGPIVLIIDEAQALSEEALETLRLFTNIETEQQKLLQIVLFAQPELNKKINTHHLRQLNQRISFSYHLQTLNPLQTYSYIMHRLNNVCFGRKININFITALLIYYFSKGTPRVINIICHKALLLAYSKNKYCISFFNSMKAISDTECIDRFIVKYFKLMTTIVLLGISTTALAFFGGS